MKKLAIATVLGLGLLGFQSASRALEYGPDKGEWEVTLGGIGANDKNFDHGSFGVDGSLGYYLTPALELSIRQQVNYSDLGNSDWNGATRLALDYHFCFLEGRLRPYIG